MSKASFIATSAAAASMAFSQSAYAAEKIDNVRVAEKVASYIVANCPTTQAEAQDPEKVKLCIAAGADMSNSIAVEMGNYLAEVSASTSPFWAGTAKGDLMANCYGPMNRLGGEFSNLENYLDAAFNAVKACEESMVRAGEAVEIDYQPTARNTVSCHMNKLKGYACE